MTVDFASRFWEAPVRLPRRAILVVACALLSVTSAAFVALYAVESQNDASTQVLIGSWDSETIGVHVLLASVLLCLVIVCAIRAPGWWLLLFVPLRLVALLALCGAGLLTALTSGATVVPLVADGCRTGYVVAERPRWQHTDVAVLETDGLLATTVARPSQTGAHSFAQGDYDVEVDGDTIRISWGTPAHPPLELPVIDREGPRSC